MESYFSYSKIEQLVTDYNWELVQSGDKYKLRQKDKHYITTGEFSASEEVVKRFCVTLNR